MRPKFRSRTRWRVKLEKPRVPKVVNIPPKMARFGTGTITPYWRVVKEDGSLNPKFPGGVAQQKRYLRAEGFATRRQGDKLKLSAGFAAKLHKLA